MINPNFFLLIGYFGFELLAVVSIMSDCNFDIHFFDNGIKCVDLIFGTYFLC